MKRFGLAAWSGSLRNGNGSVSTESQALDAYPYSFFSRYGEKPGTNPEELLGAAHAACFAMSFVRMLGMAHFEPERLDSKSEVVIEKDGVTVLVDPMSLDFLKGAEIDYVDDLIGAAFKIHNPNATSSCGCGTSFSV